MDNLVESTIKTLVLSGASSAQLDDIEYFQKILTDGLVGDIFDLVSSELSSNQISQIELTLNAKQQANNILQIEGELEDVWKLNVSIVSFQVLQGIRLRDEYKFRFAITSISNGLITGTIKVVGEVYSELARKYELEHGSLPIK